MSEGGGVTLLRYGPPTPQPPPDLRQPPNNNNNKFLGRLRRRSRSAPRRSAAKEPRPIVYSANGERLKTAQRGPEAVQLVGFSGHGEQDHRSTGSRLGPTNKTSAELKGERRLRSGAERSGMTGRWDHDRKLPLGSGGRQLSMAELLAEREKLFMAQRQYLEQQHNGSLKQKQHNDSGLKNSEFFSQVYTFKYPVFESPTPVSI